MKEQIFILENISSFYPEHIFECGQCFRWNKQEDGSYIGVFNKNVLNVKKYEKKIVFQGICEKDIHKICMAYFDLEKDYEKIKKKLSYQDIDMQKAITYGEGIRILNQDLWETLISFIISANNNIPRIKRIIEMLSQTYGTKIVWKGQSFYTFPTPEQLASATVEDLRKLGLGFRDKRIYQTTQKILTGEINLEQMKQEQDLQKLRQLLLDIPGVGPKVADCILLFSLKRYEVFPIDVWVKRIMNELYLNQQDERKIDPKQIYYIAQKKYGNLAGIAQQYLFYWKRQQGKGA